jgi:hypothetical protein
MHRDLHNWWRGCAVLRNGRRWLLIILLAHGAAAPLLAQGRLYSFSTTNGTYYRDVKIIRVEEDSVLYSFTHRAGGGRVPFRDLPPEMVDEFRALKQRQSSFAETVAPGGPHANVLAESASSDSTLDGAKGDAALLGLNNASSKLFCAFSRETMANESRFLIVVNHDGPKFLDLNSQDSLAFNADGHWIKYSPLPGSFHEELKGGRPVETAAYESSLPDIRKIGQAATLSIRVTGLTGEEDFAVPATNILKKFAHFCETNGPDATAPPPAKKAAIYSMSEEETRLNQSPYFRTIVNEPLGRVQQWVGHPPPDKLPGCRVTMVREFQIGGPPSYRLGFELRDAATNTFSLMPTNPVSFQIDGEKFSLPNPNAKLSNSTGPAGESIQQWYSPAPEELVRKLAAAKEATVELPGETPFDYQLSSVELDRFALFARVFMGVKNAAR